MEEFSAANRLNWNDRAELHATDTTGSYRIAKVLAGGSSLYSLETGEIGDISGKDVVHLQCHIGLDTISLKHLGAGSATGLDFSPAAIAAARNFAVSAGADVRFVEASVYNAIEALGQTYDMVFVSWGSVNWLDDIFRWGRVVASLLRPGGRLYLAEGHPLMFQCDRKGARLELQLDWRTPERHPIVWNEPRTYTGDGRALTHVRYYEWIHPLSDVVNALIQAGLAIDFLNEHEMVSWQHFPFAVATGDMFSLPDHCPKIPMAYSIGATKRKNNGAVMNDVRAEMEIRALTEADADAFRTLRLMALRDTPEAFGSSYQEEVDRPREHFVARAAPPEPSAMFGAFAGAQLVGTAGLLVSDRLKERHKAYMWGVFVLADFRGQGVGRKLVQHVIDGAAGNVRVLQCSVVTAQEATRRMYHAMGFVPYGLERNALCIDGVFYDEELLAIDLRPGS